MNAATAARPTLECDIVMKGGVTSGVVYPLAVCELAQAYRFRSIGGTSAGAIAAAATAAAELGRDVPGAGFAKLAELPAWLGSGGRLFRLFQPQPATHRLFSIVEAAATPGAGRAMAVIRALAVAYAGGAVLAALPGLVAAGLAAIAGGALGWLAAAAGIVAALLLAPVGALVALARDAIGTLPGNGFGICTGLGSPGTDAPALSTWLADLVDALAGRPAGSDPVTFGDLWGPGEERAMDLVLMTTSLTHGRPFRLPFADDRFWFDPRELRAYLPERLVRWMEDHPPVEDGPDEAHGVVDTRGGRFRRLPSARDLPVAFAARLSCSFPVLLSAVPLWAVDYTRTVAAGRPRTLERCWFSDGGICTNFPVHLFDAPLPTRPTFGINLKPFHPDHPRRSDEAGNVWMPDTNGQGWVERLYPLVEGAGGLPAFLMQVLSTMQNWRDNGLMRMPGYRDRIVHVNLDESVEGGLNLAMPPELVRRLGERGRGAGRLLRERYAGPPQPGIDVSWDNHRWVRYRAFLASFQQLVRSAFRGHQAPARGRTYAELATRGPDEPPASYRWASDGQREAGVDTMTRMIRLAEGWTDEVTDLANRAPHPRADLRITPRD